MNLIIDNGNTGKKKYVHSDGDKSNERKYYKI